jgi:hypothetical protein
MLRGFAREGGLVNVTAGYASAVVSPTSLM